MKHRQTSAAQRPYTVILLLSAHHAVRVESLLLRAGIACKLIPVPRQISSECGVCLRVATCTRERVVSYLTSLGVKIVGVHDLDDRG